MWLYDMSVKNGRLFRSETLNTLMYNKLGNAKCCSFEHAEFDQCCEKVAYFFRILGMRKPPIFLNTHMVLHSAQRRASGAAGS
jgi:hypothetical protein